MAIGVGLAGLGVVSQYYIRALTANPGVTLIAACDSDPGKLRQAGAAGLAVTSHFDELIRHPDVDAVVVALPNHLHTWACQMALKAGKHVCCEKPLASSATVACGLVRLARSASRTLMTSFHRRYNNNFTSALAAVRGRRVCRVDAYYLEDIREHSASDHLLHASLNRGCIADNGSNVFDLLALLLQKIDSVKCHAIKPTDGVETGTHLQLTDTAGAVANVFLDWEYEGERKTLDIVCTDGFTTNTDLLAGSSGFKSSLNHEYELLVADFTERIHSGHPSTQAVTEVVSLVETAYHAVSEYRRRTF